MIDDDLKIESGLGSAAARPKPGKLSNCGEAFENPNTIQSAHKIQAAFTEDEETTLASDRRFFGRFQERRHYIRPACQGEVATLHELGASTPPLGRAWFTIVRKVGAKCRMRLWIVTAELIHHEASENDALAIWKALGGPSEVRP